MLPVLLATVVALVVLAGLATLRGRRATARRRLTDERRRSRRRDLAIDEERDLGFRSWRAEELAFEHQAKRTEAERASRAADVYAHLAQEQETKAAELTEESEDAAARAGLEDIRVRRLEADADQPTGPDQ